MAEITILGSGGWGIAMGLSAYNCGHSVTLWSPFEDEVKMLSEKRTSEKLLKGIEIPKDIKITNDMSVIKDSLITVIATPSVAVASVAEQISRYKKNGIIVNLSKGLEGESYRRLSIIIKEKNPDCEVVVLSGPSHAEEVARNIPTSLVAASTSISAASIVQDELSSEFLRIYTSDDVVGVELGGAIKNVIAICAGICDGLKLGDNSKAALITRGLAEMSRLGVKMGANERTFSGLAGIGDLVVTCTSRHSRNNRFGNLVGNGVDIKTALAEVGTVEGYYAARLAYDLANKYNVSMPIVETCYKVLYENYPIDTVVKDLMLRPKTQEH